jgi:hypothetical protein
LFLSDQKNLPSLFKTPYNMPAWLINGYPFPNRKETAAHLISPAPANAYRPERMNAFRFFDERLRKIQIDFNIAIEIEVETL